MNHANGGSRIGIRAIETRLPERVLTNAELEAENPDWNLALVEKRMGVHRRHIAAPEETALDLGLVAVERLFDRHPTLAGAVDTLIFCTQSADYLLPPNSCVLHGKLDLQPTVMAFDLNHACSGYLYGLAIAESMIRSGRSEHVILVTADTYSSYIHPRDRSARVLFGDGAAATWIAAIDGGGGVIDDLSLGTDGSGYQHFSIPAGGCRRPRGPDTAIEEVDRSGNVRTAEHIHMAGNQILHFVSSTIPPHVKELLTRNELSTDDVDRYVFHQASAVVLDNLQRLLRLEPDRMVGCLADVGNTVSASIPISIGRAVQDGTISPGDRLLLCGFGVGLSWGSALVTWT